MKKLNFNTSYYFAYGSNMNHKHMKTRCPNSKYIGQFTLNNWELVFRGVADIQKAKNKKVVGGLFKITRKCEKALDIYEGFPYLYTKGYMESEIDGKKMTVMVYIMNDQDCIKPPSDFYLATIKEGYRNCGVSERLLNVAVSNSYNERVGLPRAGFSWGIPRPKTNGSELVDEDFDDDLNQDQQTFWDDTKPYGWR